MRDPSAPLKNAERRAKHCGGYYSEPIKALRRFIRLFR
jgi:hypothetical protein